MSSMHSNNTVGVITLPGRFNYGNRLQNYAVMQIWRSLGFVPTTLELGNRPNITRSIKHFVKHAIGKKDAPDPSSLMSSERRAAFERFNEKIPTRYLSELNAHLVDEYTLFSVGSDQVWNPRMITYNDDWYFLEFAQSEQRIALAPSIGLNNLSASQARRLSKGIQGFSNPSVREKRGAELIQEYAGVEAEVICDPTLVMPEKEWRSLAETGRVRPNEYVFTYMLGTIRDDVRILIDAATRHGEIPVVSLSDREKPGEPPAGPSEFINLIAHANCVITDSYHASIFSSIFRTPLIIVKRGGDGEGMFSRLETLTQILGIQDKIWTSGSYDAARAANYEGVSDAIARERERFLAYLEGCIND
jgi:hypothetical protein